MAIIGNSCFLLASFCSFGKAVSEEKIFRNRPIRNKNCLWQPYLLMDRDEMSNPQEILVSDWSISKKSSPLKQLGQMERNLV
jgi:hypothetical protein